jgi:hypothetical protein
MQMPVAANVGDRSKMPPALLAEASAGGKLILFLYLN